MLDMLIRQREYLLDVSRALTARLSLSEVLRRILRSGTEMLGGQAGLIALAQGDGFTVRASYGIPAPLLAHFKPLLIDIPQAAGPAFSIPELDRKMQVVAQAAGLGFSQVVALPMVIGAELVGVVYIFRALGGFFDPNAVMLLQSFADQAAIAVQNARLYEQALEETQRLDAILRHSADGILILHNDLRIERANLALARMTGVTVEEASSRHHNEVIRWARRVSDMDLTEAVAGGWPLSLHSVLYVEGDLLHSSGAALSVGITYAPLFDSNEQFRHIIANVRDITRFREAEAAKDTFISVISHELKTPVSLIKGYASTLNRSDVEWDRPTTSNGLQVIEEEADKLTELIDNLLDATRVQAGRLRLQFTSVNLPAVAARLAEKFQTQTTLHRILIDFPPDFPIIHADERRLGQVFSNLISNAIKYSPRGGEVWLRAAVLPDAVEISVSDQGIGLSPEQQALIFNRFYRVENALTRETQGAGLGLYIVRSIVEAHGGKVSVVSEEGKGATMRVLLPLSQQFSEAAS